MTRESKIGLLVGMGVIIFFGILVADHFSVQQQEFADQLAGPTYGSENAVDPATSHAQAPVAPVQTLQNPAPTPSEEQVRRDAASRRLFQVDPAPSQHATTEQTPSPQTTPQTPTTENAHSPLSGSNFVPAHYTHERATPPAPAPNILIQSPPSHDNFVTSNNDRVHYVKDNENLSTIAKQYYGDSKYFMTIYEANKDILPSPDDVRAGVRLVIPNRAGMVSTPTSNSPSPSPVRPSNESADYKTYTVEKGDTASQLAQRFYGTSKAAEKLYQLNKDVMKSVDDLRIGVTIRVPKS